MSEAPTSSLTKLNGRIPFHSAFLPPSFLPSSLLSLLSHSSSLAVFSALSIANSVYKPSRPSPVSQPVLYCSNSAGRVNKPHGVIDLPRPLHSLITTGHRLTMASVSSLDKDLRNMRLSRYTPQAATEVRNWVEEILGERLTGNDLLDALKDGVALCK